MYFSTAVENGDDAIKRGAERPPWCAVGSADKDHRRIAVLWRRLGRQGSPTFELKISKLPNHINRARNALIFNGYVIAT